MSSDSDDLPDLEETDEEDEPFEAKTFLTNGVVTMNAVDAVRQIIETVDHEVVPVGERAEWRVRYGSENLAMRHMEDQEGLLEAQEPIRAAFSRYVAANVRGDKADRLRDQLVSIEESGMNRLSNADNVLSNTLRGHPDRDSLARWCSPCCRTLADTAAFKAHLCGEEHWLRSMGVKVACYTCGGRSVGSDVASHLRGKGHRRRRFELYKTRGWVVRR